MTSEFMYRPDGVLIEIEVETIYDISERLNNGYTFKKLDDVMYKWLCTSKNEPILFRELSYPACSNFIEQLIDNNEYRFISHIQSIPIEILYSILKDKSWYNLYGLLERSDLTEGMVFELAHHREKEVRGDIVKITHDLTIMEILLNDDDPYVRAQLAKRDDLPLEFYEKLANRETEKISGVRATVASNESLNIPIELLKKLIFDKSKAVRYAALRNKRVQETVPEEEKQNIIVGNSSIQDFYKKNQISDLQIKVLETCFFAGSYSPWKELDDWITEHGVTCSGMPDEVIYDTVNKLKKLGYLDVKKEIVFSKTKSKKVQNYYLKDFVQKEMERLYIPS